MSRAHRDRYLEYADRCRELAVEKPWAAFHFKENADWWEAAALEAEAWDDDDQELS